MGIDHLHSDYVEDAGEAPDDVVQAVGKASEAFEYLVRARGHLYSFHQLMGRVDFLLEEAADQLADAGEHGAAEDLRTTMVGRNVLDGRWTFQIVEEFDALYWDEAERAVRRLEHEFQGGRRHVFEARLKEERRSDGRPGHEHRPPASHSSDVETDGDAAPPPSR
jgi:hypothetical protein